MKKLYFLLISGLMLISGCMADIPVISDSDQNLKTWLTLPEPAGLSIENSLFASSKINGNQGGELILQGSYPAYTNRIITVSSRLVVPPNSYSGVKTLTQSVGTGSYTDFGPAMVFNQPLLLDFSISGLDLTNIDPAQINFYYIDTTGVCETVQYDSLEINIVTGTLSVVRARIPHFSRYGWAK